MAPLDRFILTGLPLTARLNEIDFLNFRQCEVVLRVPFKFDIKRISINSNSVNLIEYKNVFLIFVGTALAAVRQ